MVTMPEKYFYTIGDVSELTKVKPHVLRYWESHFKILRPARRYSGHRKYTQREVDLINKIRYLVIDRRYTIAGAKREIYRQVAIKPKAAGAHTAPALPQEAIPVIQDIKQDLDDCLRILQPKATQSELGLN